MYSLLKIFAFFVLVFAVRSSISRAQSQTESRLVFSKFAFGLPIGTVNYLKAHNCTIRKTRKRQLRSVERWTDAFLQCRDLIDNDIPTVVCERKCVDPSSCKTMADFIGRPVTIERNVTDRFHVNRGIEIPVACKCVPWNPTRVANCSNMPRRWG